MGNTLIIIQKRIPNLENVKKNKIFVDWLLLLFILYNVL